MKTIQRGSTQRPTQFKTLLQQGPETPANTSGPERIQAYPAAQRLQARASTRAFTAMSLGLSLVFSLLSAGCADPQPTPTASPSPGVTDQPPTEPVVTPTSTPENTPTGTPAWTPTATLPVTPGPSWTPWVSPGPSETPSLSPTPTGTPLLSPTPTLAPTPTPGPTPETDVDSDGYSPVEGDCDDTNASIHPNASEVPYDGIDQDCDLDDETDVDNDGYDAAVVGGQDCNDQNQNTYPGATEIGDGEDNDCDGSVDEGLSITDDDGDGYSEAQGDCDDSDVSVSPEGVEVPYDGIDQDCSGLDLTDVDGDGAEGGEGGTDCDDTNDEVYPGSIDIPYDGIDQDCLDGDLVDVDEDGFASTEVADGTDCDDDAADVNPDAEEVCDHIDNNCDAIIDSDATDRKPFHPDSDSDGYGAANSTVYACSAQGNLVVDGTDCDDSRADVSPGSPEVCDLADNDCDGSIDEGVQKTYYQDNDADGYGSTAETQSCALPTGYSAVSGDCNDGRTDVNPAATEVCDAIDNNCNGSVDESVLTTYYRDSDGDGWGTSESTLACTLPSGYATRDGDCNDQSAAINPQATETCNAVDDDCDLTIDEGVKTTYYLDKDSDGYGSLETTEACSLPAGYSAVSGDCDPLSASVHPGATETCNGVDDNCSGQVDEGVKTTYYQDADGDGHGNPNVTSQACSVPTGYVTTADDCNDANANLWGTCNTLPSQTGLIGFYRFEETSATTTADGSGQNNHGKVMTGVVRTTGKVGSGIKTKDGACVVIPDSASLSNVGVNTVSYMAWINYTSPCNSDRGMVLNKESTYEMGINCNGGDYFQEAVQIDNGNWFWTGSTLITRSTWQHVGVVYNGSTVTQYVNGVAVGSRALTGNFSDRATGMGIGCRGVDAAGTTPSSSYFNGTLDEVAVYNRALSASEILSYYNATK